MKIGELEKQRLFGLQANRIFQRGYIMEGGFYTLQDFMTYTKGVTYLIMIVSLIAITGFWLFLTERDTDTQPVEHHESEHH